MYTFWSLKFEIKWLNYIWLDMLIGDKLYVYAIFVNTCIFFPTMIVLWSRSRKEKWKESFIQTILIGAPWTTSQEKVQLTLLVFKKRFCPEPLIELWPYTMPTRIQMLFLATSAERWSLDQWTHCFRLWDWIELNFMLHEKNICHLAG